HDAEEWLTIAEHVLENYRPASAIGGWSMFPLQNDPDQADAYTGTLAASALLAVREANLPWNGTAADRDLLLAATVGWLANPFSGKGIPPGWAFRDEAGRVEEGVTLQIYPVLLQAEAEAGLPISGPILEAIPKHLILCGDRSREHVDQRGTFRAGAF